MINTAVIVILFAMSLSNFCPSKEEKLYKLHDPFIPGFFVYVLIIDIIMYTFRTLCWCFLWGTPLSPEIFSISLPKYSVIVNIFLSKQSSHLFP